MNRLNDNGAIVSALTNVPEKMPDEEIGITEFVNKKLKPIGGIIKSTWSDYRILELRERDQKVNYQFEQVRKFSSETELNRSTGSHFNSLKASRTKTKGSIVYQICPREGWL